MYFTKDDIKRIKEASKGKLLDVIGDFHELRKRGAEYKCECPKCHGQEKLHISPAKQIFKCFSCPDIKGKEPLDYLQRAEDMQFLEALDHLARKFNVLLDPKPENKPAKPTKMKKQSKEAKGESVDTFCARMLAGSGLTYQDVTAHIFKKEIHRVFLRQKLSVREPLTNTAISLMEMMSSSNITIWMVCRLPICVNYRGVVNWSLKCITVCGGNFRMNTGTRKGSRSNTSLLPVVVRPYTFRNA